MTLRNRFIEIDILRVIAICYIIMVRHIDDYASDMFQCQFVNDFTHISLGILVFISGYLLSKTNTTFNSISDIKGFIVKKIVRIYPLYALALLAFYLLSIVNIYQLYSGLLFINLFNGEHILTLWYISMLMFFYIIFIVLNYKSNTLKLWLVSALIFSLLIIEKVTVNILDGTLILYFPSFVCGILLEKYSNYLKLNNNKALFIFCIYLMVLSIKPLVSPKLGIMIVSVMTISFTLSFMYLFSIIKLNAFVMKAILHLSYASFCMYLFHRIVFVTALLIYKPNEDLITLLYLYLVAIPLVWAVSFYVQKFYDKCIKLLNEGNKNLI